jgi:hypothetical protein
MAVGSFLVGLFQDQNAAVMLGLISIVWSFTLTMIGKRVAEATQNYISHL